MHVQPLGSIRTDQRLEGVTDNKLSDRRRTELMIIIWLTVLANRMDVHRVTEEIKAGMVGLQRAVRR